VVDVLDGGLDRTAIGMAKDNNERHVQFGDGIFDAAGDTRESAQATTIAIGLCASETERKSAGLRRGLSASPLANRALPSIKSFNASSAVTVLL
jgi:hypothetical protein